MGLRAEVEVEAVELQPRGNAHGQAEIADQFVFADPAPPSPDSLEPGAMLRAPCITAIDYWVKDTGMLQQNWAVIEPEGRRVGRSGSSFDHTSGVFDEMPFATADGAARALRRNGFERYPDDEDAQGFIARPEGPVELRQHPNGPIYSSGRFWII